MKPQYELFNISQRKDYTFKYNSKLGRHGWLRLTPAYSVKLVKEIIDEISDVKFILDPFSGTGTTGLVAAEHGFNANIFDINPFLVWFGNTKCKNYLFEDVEYLRQKKEQILELLPSYISQHNWEPDIHNIERWWSRDTLLILSALHKSICEAIGNPQDNSTGNLLWVAFNRLIIETSSAAFNHVSMSFHNYVKIHELDQIRQLYSLSVDQILSSVKVSFIGNANAYLIDSKNFENNFNDQRYSHVITSPPYPNRISYIRELRPYMYWSKFLSNSNSAGELDWESIGGTWGIATSRLKDWQPTQTELQSGLNKIIENIVSTDKKYSNLLAKYVLKYFHDMHIHFDTMRKHLSNNARIYYIIGNSSFYGAAVPTHELLAESLHQLGYKNIQTKVIRKRNTKKQLYEYCISATYIK